MRSHWCVLPDQPCNHSPCASRYNKMHSWERPFANQNLVSVRVVLDIERRHAFEHHTLFIISPYSWFCRQKNISVSKKQCAYYLHKCNAWLEFTITKHVLSKVMYMYMILITLHRFLHVVYFVADNLDELLWSPYASSENSGQSIVSMLCSCASDVCNPIRCLSFAFPVYFILFLPSLYAVRQYLVQVSNVLLAQDGLPNGSLDRDNEQVLDNQWVCVLFVCICATVFGYGGMKSQIIIFTSP